MSICNMTSPWIQLSHFVVSFSFLCFRLLLDIINVPETPDASLSLETATVSKGSVPISAAGQLPNTHSPDTSSGSHTHLSDSRVCIAWDNIGAMLGITVSTFDREHASARVGVSTRVITTEVIFCAPCKEATVSDLVSNSFTLQVLCQTYIAWFQWFIHYWVCACGGGGGVSKLSISNMRARVLVFRLVFFALRALNALEDCVRPCVE